MYVKEQPPMTNLYHGDPTGDHPTSPRSDNVHVSFMVAEDVSYNNMELYQDRETKTLTKAYKNGFDFFMKYEPSPTYLRLDNKTNVQFETLIARRHLKMQYAPPGQ